MRFSDRIKQFGVFNTLKTTFYYILRPVFAVHEYKVLIINNHKAIGKIDNVKTINEDKLKHWLDTKQISSVEHSRFLNFINTDCLGYYIEVENELAAWGFVQTKGKYKYGQYYYELPQNVQLLKNLFVKPQFRGMSLGKIINSARINGISSGQIPCVFVIPENRYAIRNLKKVGFELCFKVRKMVILKKYTITKVVRYMDNNADYMIRGLNN